MDREEAVASIVAAEVNAEAPLEALKAQAVVTRSFLAAGGRHREFDFCDTTHCQFLRSPPGVNSAVVRAVEATRGLVLSYRHKTIAALYSSRCGGRTHSLHESGMDAGEGYPYFPVECRRCRQYPTRWRSRIEEEARLTAGNERERLEQARLWGWSAMPGSDFKMKRDGDSWLIEGNSVGHGLGMCQFGAAGMAESGADFQSILQHYYPNSELLVVQ
jgi:stage II sporulation protein D